MSKKIDLINQRFYFSNHTITIKRVKNLDDLIDRVSDEEFAQDERLPYWAELWPSAEALSRFIFRNPQFISGRSILELGCGLGLTSISLARQQPRKLVITDYEQAALDIAAMNFKQNKLPIPECKLMDWRYSSCERRYDCIVASDVVYEERFFLPLLRVFHQCLNEEGVIILAEPNRAVARDFFALLKEKGYHFDIFPEAVMQDGKSIQVSIYTIRPL